VTVLNVNLLHGFHEAGVIQKCCRETWSIDARKPLGMVIYEFIICYYFKKCISDCLI
jgi:hypothetical protein